MLSSFLNPMQLFNDSLTLTGSHDGKPYNGGMVCELQQGHLQPPCPRRTFRASDSNTSPCHASESVRAGSRLPSFSYNCTRYAAHGPCLDCPTQRQQRDPHLATSHARSKDSLLCPLDGNADQRFTEGMRPLRWQGSLSTICYCCW